jgi:hypothetical protein
MSFKIDRNRYETTDLSFSGMPQVANAPDVPGDTKVTFQVEVKEDLIDDLRRSLTNPQGFDVDLSHGEYRFKLRNCRLTGPIPDRDYARHRVVLTFETLRQNIVEMVRPMGPPPPPDHTDVFLSQLHLLTQEHDRIRRGRIRLQEYDAELKKHWRELEAEEAALELKKAALFATGTPELLAMAHGRGL